MTSNIPTLALRGATSTVGIPQLGFGVWEVPDDAVTDVVLHALKTGYRLVDTATVYANEEGVGRALARTEVPREDIFVTTKVWNDSHGYDQARRALDDSLARLGTSYVDLYLIHWPVPSADKYVETWKGLLSLREEGKARAVGVCNFHQPHLERLNAETGEYPCINQIEVHPYLTQEPLRAFNAQHGIITQDWSPLGARLNVIEDPAIVAIAQALGVTAAQVVLRWHLQLGSVVIPRSTRPERIASNFELFSFELSDEHMAAISALNRDRRSGPDPDRFSLGA